MKSENLKTKYKIPKARKGIVLIIILMLVAAITIVGLGFIVRGDTELLCGQNMEMATSLSYLAESGLEHARGLILCPQDISTEYWPGATALQLTSGSDYYDVAVTKISDCNWAISSTAYRKINNSRTAEASYIADLRLDPAIAVWSGTDFSLSPDANVIGDIYCNGNLINSGTIKGDCFADSLTTSSPITGAVKAKTDLQLDKPTINCSILKSNFAYQTISSSSLNGTTLGGASQVYYRNGNLEIKKNVIINGCLAVDGNLTISDTGNTINALKHVPAIYVSGNLIIKENAALDCNGLVFVDGLIETSICNRALKVIGALFTDEGMRNGIVPDDSVFDNDGVINGNCALVTGSVNGAISFDGDGDFIDVGNLPVTITNRFTISAFIKVNAFDKPYQAIVTKGDTSWRLQREGSTNKIQFVCNIQGGPAFVAYMTNGFSVNDGLWHHIAGVYDGITSTISIYLDGIWAGGAIGQNGNIATNAFPVYIGENAEIRDRYFNGAIDQVRIYNSALTQGQIQTIAVQTTGLVGYWPMDWGNCPTTVNAAPTKAAIYHWPSGEKNRWSPAAGAFYKSIARN